MHFPFTIKGYEKKGEKNQGYIQLTGGVSLSIGIPPWGFVLCWQGGFLVSSLSPLTNAGLWLSPMVCVSEPVPTFRQSCHCGSFWRRGPWVKMGLWFGGSVSISQSVSQSVNKSLFISVGTELPIRWLGHVVSLPAVSPPHTILHTTVSLTLSQTQSWSCWTLAQTLLVAPISSRDNNESMKLSLPFRGTRTFTHCQSFNLSPISLFLTPNGTTCCSHLCTFASSAPFPPRVCVSSFFSFFPVQLNGYLSHKESPPTPHSDSSLFYLFPGTSIFTLSSSNSWGRREVRSTDPEFKSCFAPYHLCELSESQFLHI